MPARTALVLSGGGSRGAYEAGVVRGIVSVLGLRGRDDPPFRIFVGTSVGAINTAYLASNADRGDMDVKGLCKLWASLELRQHFDVNLRGVARLMRPRSSSTPRTERHLGGSVLDTGTLEKTVFDGIDWERLHRNVRRNKVRALVVAALRVADGRTTMFAELADGVRFVPSKDPLRHVSPQNVTADHVLASAAIPLVFPARRIGRSYYCDGGLRFNTPLAPAIRTGADRIVVVSLRHTQTPTEVPVDHTIDYPSPTFLLGKLLDALLLDPIRHDLSILERFNELAAVLEEALTPEERQRVDDVLVASRGLPYRKLRTLVFEPSRDIGEIAGEHVEKNLSGWKLPRRSRWLLQAVTRSQVGREADAASFILFDGGFAREITELGYRDALARADEIVSFFNTSHAG